MASLMSCRWRTTPVVRRMDAEGNHNLQSVTQNPFRFGPATTHSVL